MPNNVVHFEVSADDVDRARGFYERVFGWRFQPWGPPGFFTIETGSQAAPGIEGALAERAVRPDGADIRAFICTVSVDDIDAVRAAVLKEGCEILYDKMEIPTVGTIIQFKDTEGNIVSAMHYEQGRTR